MILLQFYCTCGAAIKAYLPEYAIPMITDYWHTHHGDKGHQPTDCMVAAKARYKKGFTPVRRRSTDD